ncbi:response regulator with CheY-like receiver domain and winged-helix DNA-binding domain [Burkholderiales bacterium JOSHI_001]|nr:response regulator with CheY-like receiver domain and winged-helix DNA-binding domain [Burkholderiales bacterium JOSHI_001]
MATDPRVQIIEDNAANVELASFVLEDAGFVVDTVTDADDALAQVASFQPDLILMDIRLSGGDGLALTQSLKSDPATSDIVIVAFTAFAMKGDEAKLRAAGCDAYIAKPIDVASFAGQVGAALGARPPMDLDTLRGELADR